MDWSPREYNIRRGVPLKNMGSVVKKRFPQFYPHHQFGAYLGAITLNQLDNIQYIVQGFGYPSARYSPQRDRYAFSDKERELAERAKRECKDGRVCAFIISDQRRVDENTVAAKYEIDYVEEGIINPFTIRCTKAYPLASSEVVARVESREDAIKYLNTNYKGTDQCPIAIIEEIPSETHVSVKNQTKRTIYDKVHYFTLTE